MLDRIAAVYQCYGFDPLETTAVETVEALGKFLPDVDRPNEGVSPGRTRTSLAGARYDLTAPLAASTRSTGDDLPTPYRRYQVGPVWRNEKPGPGQFRQFYQCDADTVGAARVAADAEMCAMLGEALEAVGIARGDYVVRVNNRRCERRDGGRRACSIPRTRRRSASGAVVLRAIDELDRLGEAASERCSTTGADESGDFNGGRAGDTQIEADIGFVAARGSTKRRRARLRELVGGIEVGRGRPRAREDRQTWWRPVARCRGSIPRWSGASATTPGRCSRRS